MKANASWEFLSQALSDAALAVRLLHDPAYRRLLREDTATALRVFALATTEER